MSTTGKDSAKSPGHCKDDRSKCSTSGSSLKCCQFNDSSTSVSAEDKSVLCETKNDFMINPQENCDNNNEIHVLHGNMKNGHVFAKKQAIDLEFEDITFSSTTWSFSKFKTETKRILHGVSGQFKSGELSVIMGPSGAGKSTLLDILAGFKTRGSTGTVKLNDVVRTQSPRFRKLSAYIPQDEELRLALTAKEAMTFAAHLKLGYSVSNEYKMQQVNCSRYFHHEIEL
ncbi:hypothetical protein JTB14_035178 [Gonioctena quinquepunctata]|nr:hypothetical protein JTB14_035178 [Gonioctena quinquepunctata]